MDKSNPVVVKITVWAINVFTKDRQQEVVSTGQSVLGGCKEFIGRIEEYRGDQGKALL